LEKQSKAELGIELSDSTIRGVLKKNTPKTASEEMLAHTASAKRGVCGQYGGCA
jgi:hypothetical protein